MSRGEVEGKGGKGRDGAEIYMLVVLIRIQTVNFIF